MVSYRTLLRILVPALFLLPVGFAATSSYYLDNSRLELQIQPATRTASGSVTVTSNSDHPIRLKVIPKLWRLNAQGVLQYENPPTSGYNLLDNIRVNPEEFELLPGKSRLVRFLVKAPPRAASGEYPFQLYFEPTTQLEAKNGAQSANVSNLLDVVPVFTTTVYAYLGNPKPEPRVDRFECGYQPDRNQLNVQVDVSNRGNKHARLFGNVILSRKPEAGSAKILDVLHLQNSTLLIVFPESPRAISEDFALKKDQKLEVGHYQLELRLVDERNVQPAIQSTCDFTVTGK